jgi:hypothetical protein
LIRIRVIKLSSGSSAAISELKICRIYWRFVWSHWKQRFEENIIKLKTKFIMYKYQWLGLWRFWILVER